MSDPVTNVEIEDVLSSIRRLVAEGGKARDPLIANEKSVAADPAPQERFVLTPDFRVAESTVPAPEPAQVPESQDPVFVTPAAEPLVLTPSDTEPLVHDAMSMIERASLEATIAELESAVAGQADEWEPEGSVTQITGDIADAFADLAEPDVVEHSDVEAVFEEDEAAVSEVVMLHDPVTPAPVEEPTFRQTIPADEADADFGDDLQSPEDDGLPIPDDLDENIAAYLAAGGGKIDQDALRAMVVDVVRQELQGEMGERITRNVRKLVRREINNALSSKSFT